MPNPRMADDPRYSLNAICPYFTMFPLEYPTRILKNRRRKTRVLDPFCGRGTTLYAARRLAIESWGIDASPIAVAISQAKFARATTNEALALARRLIETVVPQHIPQTNERTGEFWALIYHPETLRDLCALREGLLDHDVEVEREAAALLRGLILGCLHGPLTVNLENPSYFSNQMPRTYASKPIYAADFWLRRDLQPHPFNVLKVLRKKADIIDRDEMRQRSRRNSARGQRMAATGDLSRAVCGDSTRSETFADLPDDFDAAITSPPYYGMRQYVPDQWLRAWFLGDLPWIEFDGGVQVAHSSHEAFCASLGAVWDNVGDRATQDFDLFVRFGSVPSKVPRRAPLEADQLLLQSLEVSRHPWRVVSVRRAQTASSGRRQAHQMGIASSAALEYDIHAVLA